MGLLTTLKGLPSTYNKDLQEDKEPFFNSLDTLNASLTVLAPLVATLAVHPTRMRGAVDESLLSTDLAFYLVRKGLPFRESHTLVAQLIRLSLTQQRPLSHWPLSALRRHSRLFQPDVKAVFDVKSSLARRSLPGGTGLRALRQQLKLARKALRPSAPSPAPL